MLIQLTNIITKGLQGRLNKKREETRFKGITWLQEKILKHQEDKTTKTIQFGQNIINYKRPYELLHTYPELFQQEIYRFETAKEKPFIIDCGANIGVSVLYFKAIFPNATILAFEPDEVNCGLLKQNVAANNLDGVEVQNSAVWVKDEQLMFESSASEAGFLVSGSPAGKNLTPVNAIRLATVLAEREVDFLKMDIEGAEFEVVKDCAPYLANVKNMFVEYHGKVDETAKLSELLSILEAQNYKVYIKMASDNLRFPFVTKSTGNNFDVQLNIFCYR